MTWAIKGGRRYVLCPCGGDAKGFKGKGRRISAQRPCRKGEHMNVREIVKEYLEKNGYDGLYSDECGCQSNDLMPCDAGNEKCIAGHKVPCDPDSDFLACDGNCDFHIGPMGGAHD